MAKAKATQDNPLKGVTGATRAPLEKMVEAGMRVQVVGRVNNGKVEFDQATLEQLARKFPNAKMAFVAVNAPFDPVLHQG